MRPPEVLKMVTLSAPALVTRPPGSTSRRARISWLEVGWISASLKALVRAKMLAARIEGLGSGTVVSDTDISGRLLCLKISGYLYVG